MNLEWSENGGIYMPAGQGFSALAAGAYTATATQRGGVIKAASITTDGLLMLEDSPVVGVINNVRAFWKAKPVFKHLGLMHKRGGLLWGPPGTGKTAAVEILAQDVINSGGVVLMCEDHPRPLRDCIGYIRSVEPDRPIVCIMEDLEDLIAADERTLLSMLDGENSVEGIVYMATTNNITQIPERIRNRPSRFDEVLEVGFPSLASRRAYLAARTHGYLEAPMLDKWAADTQGMGMSHLRELIVGVLALNRPYEEVLGRLRGLHALPVKKQNNKSVGEALSLLFRTAEAAADEDDDSPTWNPQLSGMIG